MALAGRQALGAATIAVVASGALGVGIAAANSRSAPSYGSLPSFLPVSSMRPDAVVDGSATHPALVSEGDGVRVTTPHGSALITVAGPVVPGEGLPFQTTADTATWTVTVLASRGRVPISTRDFYTVDSHGATYRPAFVPGQPRPPAMLHAGDQASFELRVVIAVGEGVMRWEPIHRNLVASWDFVVEND